MIRKTHKGIGGKEHNSINTHKHIGTGLGFKESNTNTEEETSKVEKTRDRFLNKWI